MARTSSMPPMCGAFAPTRTTPAFMTVRSQAEAQLDPGLFVRVHRSHIVAIPHVSFVRREGDGAVIELDGPTPHRVPVSRAKIAEVKARLGLARRHASH